MSTTYYSTAGPRDRSVKANELPCAIGVHDTPEPSAPVGIAFDAGSIPGLRGRRIQLWRLVVRGVEVPGRFALIGRMFIPAGRDPAQPRAKNRGRSV